MVVALFGIDCFFIKTIIHHSAQEPCWLPCSLRFCVWPSLFWDGQAYRCVQPLYAQALPPRKLRNVILVVIKTRFCTFVVASCPSTLVNTQGLCFVLTIAQYFVGLYTRRILKPGFSYLCQGYFTRFYLYDYL